jgi:rhomboid protease GluP
MPASVPYVTYSIVGVTALIYLLQLASVQIFQIDLLEALGAKNNTLIQHGQFWRLLTPALLHANPPHILFNMYALIVLGVDLERNFGRWRFLTLYILGAITGNVFSFLLTSSDSVGASTAIFGLIGAEGIVLYQNRKLLGNQFGRAIGNIIFVAAINLFLGLTPGIDNWGHIGGLLGGLIFTWFAGPRFEVKGIFPSLHLADTREPREVLTGVAAVVLIFGTLMMIGILHPITP